MFRRKERLARKPATDSQLALIWPAWNALPDDLLPDEKRTILTLADYKLKHESTIHVEFAKKLRKQFKYLPLDWFEFYHALIAACRWSSLMDYIATTTKNHRDLVARNWGFADANRHAAGRVVIFRVAAEIGQIHPGLLECKSPTLAQIQILINCQNGYTVARANAFEVLSKYLYQVPDMRSDTRLPYLERARGVPNPPYLLRARVPHYLYLARLAALNICNQKAMDEFMRKEYPKLTWQKKLKFKAMSRKPKFGKNPYLGFLVWIHDNRPIFENPKFDWRWKDIVRAAQARKIDCPKTGLKQWSHRSKAKLKLKIGQLGYDTSGMELSSILLSPAPVFGDLLNPDSIH